MTCRRSHNSTAISEVRRSTVVWVLSSPQPKLVALVQYKLTDVDAVIKLNWLGAGQQRHVSRTSGGRDGARHVLADERPLQCISEIVSCRQVETDVRNSCNTIQLSASSGIFLHVAAQCGLRGYKNRYPLRFLAGCRKKRLNQQALSVLPLSLGFF